MITGIGDSLPGNFDHERDLAGRRILPGGIDPHVHFALPVGARVTADDFSSGSRRALSGGVTTVFDFTTPVPGVPIDETVRRRMREAESAGCSVFLHATVCGWDRKRETEAENCLELGVQSFKFFTTYKESGRMSTYDEIASAAEWAAHRSARLLIHAEDQDSIVPAASWPSDSFRYYEESRPVESEIVAISRLMEIRQRTGAAMAIVHVSSGSGAEQARGSGLRLETCPHYLRWTRETYDEAEGYRFAVAPPLRSRAEQELLWKSLESDGIDWIGSDHAPFSDLERIEAGDHFVAAPYGLPGVDTIFSTLLESGIKNRRITWERLVALTSTAAARFYGLYPKKGCICEGSDADLIALDEKNAPEVLTLNRVINRVND